MGLLNATAGAAFGTRVTHLTGHVTELGINLARACLLRGEERGRALRLGALLTGKVICFAGGAAGMVFLIRWSGYAAFLTAAGLTLAASELGRIAHALPAAERSGVLGRRPAKHVVVTPLTRSVSIASS